MMPVLTARPRRIWLALLAFCTTLGLVAATSSAGTIVDNAQIFSSSAVAQAQQTIDHIQAVHHKDFNVETFASVPADQQDALNAQGRDAFFDSWARQRAKAMGTNGVYLLVCMDPHILKVAVGNQTATREFTNADKEGLRSLLVPPFKAKDFDGGLIRGAQYVSDRIDTNTRAAAAGGSPGAIAPGLPYAPVGSVGTLPINRPAGSFMGSWLCVGIAIVVFLVLLRSRRGGGFNYGGPSQGYGYGNPGGGFGSGLLGGILGGALGSWGYDRFNRNDGGSDFTGNNMNTGSSGSDFSAPSGPDTDFTTSSGGDFSGGDPGGGGGGGGDSSGGGGSSGGDF
jgi:uncharacterized membrane protein YgcG